MEPVLPDAPVEESEFDLDVRLQTVAGHSHELLAGSEGQRCPDSPSAYCRIFAHHRPGVK